jgi:hypothetical protein
VGPEADERDAVDAGRTHPLSQQGPEQIGERGVGGPAWKRNGPQPLPRVGALERELKATWHQRLEQVVEPQQPALVGRRVLPGAADVMLELDARNRVVGVERLSLVGLNAGRGRFGGSVVPDGNSVEPSLAKHSPTAALALGRELARGVLLRFDDRALEVVRKASHGRNGMVRARRGRQPVVTS